MKPEYRKEIEEAKVEDRKINLNSSNFKCEDLRDLKHYDGNAISLSMAGFNFSNLDYANLNGVNLFGTRFNGTSLRYVDFGSADLTSSCLHKADLTGANLKHANLTYAAVTNIVLPSTDVIIASPFGCCHIRADHIRIGYLYHPVDVWEELSDEEVSGIGNNVIDAVAWWKYSKPIVMGIARNLEYPENETPWQ